MPAGTGRQRGDQSETAHRLKIVSFVRAPDKAEEVRSDQGEDGADNTGSEFHIWAYNQA